MIVPIYAADRVFWSIRDELICSWVEVSLAPIFNRSVRNPSTGGASVWERGESPVLWLQTPAGTMLETNVVFDADKMGDKPRVADTKSAVIRIGGGEYDAAGMVRLALAGTMGFRVCGPGVKPVRSITDMPHRLPKSYAVDWSVLARHAIANPEPKPNPPEEPPVANPPEEPPVAEDGPILRYDRESVPRPGRKQSRDLAGQTTMF